MREMSAKALKLGLPLSVQVDLTYRCNERCVHCYLDHDDHGEMTAAEIADLLDQLAEAGALFLVLSGGEIFLRQDVFEIVAHARRLRFLVKLKTNGVMIDRARAERIADLGVEAVQVSVYSHNARVHDAITTLPGSFRRTIEGVRLLKACGVKVGLTNVLMKQNASDYPGVQALARTLGVACTIDATIAPMMDGNRDVLALNVDGGTLRKVLNDPAVAGPAGEACLPPGAIGETGALDALPCSAGHVSCYVSPYGEVYPCVQFPLTAGSVRGTPFMDIWRNSPRLADMRSVGMSDVAGCASCIHAESCSRCPGLAFLEGDMRGPSIQDCKKAFARTGVAPLPIVRTQRKQNPADETGSRTC